MNYTPEDYQMQGVSTALQQGVPMPTRTERAEFVDKIRVEPIIEKIRHQLKREYFNVDTNAWEQMEALKDKAWTDAGVYAIISWLTPMVNVAVQGANISEDQMLNRVFFFTEALLFDVGVNWREYGVKNDGMIYELTQISIATGMSTWSQAKQGHTSRTWRETTVENRQVISAPQQEKPGRLKTLLFGNK